MLRAGLIRQTAAGIYAWLPLGISRAEQNRRNRSRGTRSRRRDGIADADDPNRGSLARERRYDAYGKEMLRITDRHEREMLYGPTNEEMITEIVRDYSILQGLAADPVSYSMEIPRRGAAAVRRDAWARVPDEGCL